MNKDKVSAPTISTEAMLLLFMIDAMEEHNIITVDIPGSFMQSDMEDKDYMKLEGQTVDIRKNLIQNFIQSMKQ